MTIFNGAKAHVRNKLKGKQRQKNPFACRKMWNNTNHPCITCHNFKPELIKRVFREEFPRKTIDTLFHLQRAEKRRVNGKLASFTQKKSSIWQSLLICVYLSREKEKRRWKKRVEKVLRSGISPVGKCSIRFESEKSWKCSQYWNFLFLSCKTTRKKPHVWWKSVGKFTVI